MSGVLEASEQHEISYMRQEGWFDPSQHPDSRVTLVGVGGIGSPLALALAKLGIGNLTLIDPDTVERHNLPNQMFPMDRLGMAKVHAVDEMVQTMTPTVCTTEQMRLEEYDQRLTGIVASGLDSMEARQYLWEHMLRRKVAVPLYIDARLAGEHIVVLAIDPSDSEHIKWYEEECLYSDEEAVAAPCTRQSIIDVGFHVTALVTRAVRRHYADEPVERRVWMDVANLTITRED